MSVVSPDFLLGYIVPHLYTDMDAYQFYKVAPADAMLVTTQLNLREYSLTAVEEQMDTLLHRVDVLADRGVDVISFSGVPIASVLGRAYVLSLLDEMHNRSGIRATTDIEAHVEAFRHFGARRVALATRWPDRVTQALISYLSEAGFDVVSCRSRPRELDANKRADPLEDHYLALELGRQALEDAPSAEALMLPGGLWFAIHAVPELEAEFQIPVTLNITATLWEAMQHRPRGAARGDPQWGMLIENI